MNSYTGVEHVILCQFSNEIYVRATQKDMTHLICTFGINSVDENDSLERIKRLNHVRIKVKQHRFLSDCRQKYILFNVFNSGAIDECLESLLRKS